MNALKREYDRSMLRSAFQSLFWGVLLTRKRDSKFTLQALADKLGVNKSYVSRSFSSPPNWQIDKMSDMAESLGVELIIEARDPKTGKVFTPYGEKQSVTSSTNALEDSPPPPSGPKSEIPSLSVVCP